MAALFSAVNESIAEHLKLLFYPAVIFSLIEYFYWGKNIRSFWCVKLMGILIDLLLIPVVYYTYTGMLGVNADWFNITLFFLAAGLMYWTETKRFQHSKPCFLSPKPAVLVLLLIAATFTFLTFSPPHIPFFQDPLTGTYGFQN